MSDKLETSDDDSIGFEIAPTFCIDINRMPAKGVVPLVREPPLAAFSPPRVRRQDQNDIQTQLTTLSEWQLFQAFQSFLLFLPILPQQGVQWDFIQNAKANLDLTRDSRGTVRIWHIGQRVGDMMAGDVKVHFEKNLIRAGNAFTPQPKDADNAIFFRLSGFEADVPEVVLYLAESAFVNGLVTRLVLEEYANALERANPHYRQIVDIPRFLQSFSPGTFEDPNVWPPGRTFAQVIDAVLTKRPLQGDAILYGWYCGQQLVNSESRYKTAVWNLLKYRVDMRRVGEIVGYTLNYMEGYAKNKEVPVRGPTNDAILANLAEVSITGAQRLADFHSSGAAGTPDGLWLNDVLYTAIIQAYLEVAKRPPGAGRTKALSMYSDFLTGFNQGAIRAAEVVYADTFLLAYGLGYADFGTGMRRAMPKAIGPATKLVLRQRRRTSLVH
jgi:hypothetical protein